MIYIWVRATVDWEDEHAFLAQVDPRFKLKVDVWNETFSIPFHLFRHEVRKIARLNLSRVENAVCCEWDEIPDDGLVLPVDDDDWFAPNIADVLERNHDANAAAYRWRASFVELPINRGHQLDMLRRRIFPRWPTLYVCTTNNYAMLKRPGTKPLLMEHVDASRWVENAERGVVKKIEERLSLMNRTLGSQTSLISVERENFNAGLLRKYHGYTKLYTRRTPAGLSWCRPYLALMSELMGRLHVSGRSDAVRVVSQS